MINRQQHKTSCGPVAFKNALEFVGIRSSYDEILQFSMDFLDFEHDGMYWGKLLLGLRLSGFTPRVHKTPTFKLFSETLKAGHGIILLYRWSVKGKNSGHFVFIDQETPKSFRVWNATKTRSEWLPKKVLARHLRYSYRHCRDNEYPYMIVIKKH